MRRLTHPIFMITSILLLAGCGSSDGDSSTTVGPGTNGSNLPNGGSPDNPVGKYVGHVLSQGWQAAQIPSRLFPGETMCIYIDQDLQVVVGTSEQADEPTTIALQAIGDGDYQGELAIDEDGVSETIDLLLTYDQSVERWHATVTIAVDEDGDDIVDAAGEARMRLEPRLDWHAVQSASNATYDGIAVITEPAASATATPYAVINRGRDSAGSRRFLLDGEGWFWAPAPIWFYDRQGEMVGLTVDENDRICYEATIGELAGDCITMTVDCYAVPDTIVDADYHNWELLETEEWSLYSTFPSGVDFQQSSVTVQAKADSQIDHDTDGSAGPDDGPYYYFGSDMTGISATVQVNDIADGQITVTPPAESDQEPFSMTYGYLRRNGQGYLTMVHRTSYGDGTVGLETFVFAVDEQGQLTGDGVLQGFDFRNQGSPEIDQQDWQNMDNEGLLHFGNGIDTSLFDFIVTTADGPTPTMTTALTADS